MEIWHSEIVALVNVTFALKLKANFKVSPREKDVKMLIYLCFCLKDSQIIPFWKEAALDYPICQNNNFWIVSVAFIVTSTVL